MEDWEGEGGRGGGGEAGFEKRDMTFLPSDHYTALEERQRRRDPFSGDLLRPERKFVGDVP